MIRMRASSETALAISTSCCWPMRRSSTSVSGSDAGFQPLEEFAGPPLLRLVVDAERPPGDLARGEDVLGDRQVAEQVQLLEDHADAVRRPRRPDVAKDDRLAVEQDAPERRLLDAGDDLHQRRLAGAVLADQHVDRAAAHLEIGLLDRDGAGIDLRDVFEPQDDVVSVGRAHGYRPDRRASPG